MKLLIFSSTILSGLLLFGCSDDECCQQEILKESIIVKGNQTPISRITGLPMELECGENVNVSGKSSSDPDGEIVKYKWTLDGQSIGDETGLVVSIPCDDLTRQLCLTVEDDKGLQSAVPACQSIKVVLGDKILIPVTHKLPTPVIDKELADENQYIFSCVNSYDNDLIDTDNITNLLGADQSIETCEWSVTKYFKDSDQTIIFISSGPVKWVNVDPLIYKSIDLTLTITDDDGEKNTLTQSYIVPDDLPL